MTTAGVRTWAIQSGPSKWDFMESLGFRKRPAQEVQMRIQEAKGCLSKVCNIGITLVSQKHDSTLSPGDEQHLWGFVGYIAWDGTKNTYPIRIFGEYSTKERKGQIKEIREGSQPFEDLFRILPPLQT